MFESFVCGCNAVVDAVTALFLRHHCLFLWQVRGCDAALDAVTTLFAVSLPQQKLAAIEHVTQRIAAHPIWQWCPAPDCGRVVKLGGAGK